MIGWLGPVQNTSTSRLFAYSQQVTANKIKVYRTNDDPPSITTQGTLLPQLAQNLPIGFISDGLDGGYLGLRGPDGGGGTREHSVQRVNASGSSSWSIYPMGASRNGTEVHMSANESGDLLLLYTAQSGLQLCGTKINRLNGVLFWSESKPTCGAFGGMAGKILVNGTTGLPYTEMTSDGNGGMIVFYNLSARKINSDGSPGWTVLASPAGTSIYNAFYYNGSAYFIRRNTAANTLEMDRINVDDGSHPWAQPVTLGQAVNVSAKSYLFVTGDGELTAVWTPDSTPGRLLMNRVNVEAASAVWAQAVEVTNQAASSNWYAFKGQNDLAYVGYCNSGVPCVIQSVNRSGQKIFGASGFTLEHADGYPIGPHWRGTPDYTEFCIDEAFTDGVQVGSQMYCLGSDPTISTPICSLDDGASFTLCDEAQYGTSITHARANCLEGLTPAAEGRLAGDPAIPVHEEAPLIEGRYVVYEKAVPGDLEREIFLYDLGPDQIFGSGDDAAEPQIISSEPPNTRVWLGDVNGGRIVYGINGKVKVYDIASGTKGEISADGTYRASLDGRYLAYRTSTGRLGVVDLGLDGRLGTADDQAPRSYDAITLPSNERVRISGRNIMYRDDTLDHPQAHIFDIQTEQDRIISPVPAAAALDVWLDGRYAVWADYRNDSDGARGGRPNNGDIYLYDLGPDGIIGTGDDVGEARISTSAKDEFSPSVNGTRLVWTRLVSASAIPSWDDNLDVFAYDLGADGRFGTADDIGPSQLTDWPHSQFTPAVDNQNVVWVDNQGGETNHDVVITPVYGQASAIASVSFTLTDPSGDQRYLAAAAQSVEGHAYTLERPELINESGDWTLSATCRDLAGGTAVSETSWEVQPWMYSSSPKLAVYDGVIQVTESSGPTLEVGNAGRDLASTSQITIQPNNSTGGAVFRGVPGEPSQAMKIEADTFDNLPGDPYHYVVKTRGTGTYNSQNGANGLTSRFAGQSVAAGGAAISSVLISCEFANYGCQAAKFIAQDADDVALYAETLNPGRPALHITGGTYNAVFSGNVEITGNLQAAQANSGACAWQGLEVLGDTMCSDGRFLKGVELTNAGDTEISKIYCCEL